MQRRRRATACDEAEPAEQERRRSARLSADAAPPSAPSASQRPAEQPARRAPTTHAAALSRWRQPQLSAVDDAPVARPASATHGHAAAGEVGPQHRAQRPRLEVGALDGRVEQDRPPGAAQPVAEVDVLDRRVRVARLVEAADGEEVRRGARRRARSRTSRPGPAPAWWTWWWSRLRNAETVARRAGRVVVGAVDGGEARVGGEGGADAG